MARRAAKLSPFWAERLYPSAFVRASPLAPLRQSPNELLPQGHSPASIRSWITAICRRLNTTPTELARAAQLAPSTVNRFISGTGKNENISATTIKKLSDAALSIYDKYMQRIGDKTDPIFEELEAEADWGGVGITSFDNTVVTLPVIGFVGASYWLTHTELPGEEKYEISVPVSNVYRRLPIVGLEMRGGTSNRKFPNTTILICVPFYALDRDPVDGEFVIVNRKNDSDKIQTVVRQYMQERLYPDDEMGSRWLLCLEGEEPWQAPIRADHITDDTVVVSLLVIGSYQPEPRRFKRPENFMPKADH